MIMIKLNLGCGDKKFKGYINIDLNNDKADIKADICKLKYKNNSVNRIVLIHVFEHISPFEVVGMLKEYYKILKNKGKLVIEMPDIYANFKAYLQANLENKFKLLYLSITVFDKLARNSFFCLEPGK